MYYQNVHGLRTKFDTVRKNSPLLTTEPDIIVLTEAYLHSGIRDNELGFHGFNVYRKDRHNFANSPSGGGILIATEKCIDASVINIEEGIVEQLFAEVSNSSRKLIIGTPSPTPKFDKEKYREHAESIEDLRKKYPEC